MENHPNNRNREKEKVVCEARIPIEETGYCHIDAACFSQAFIVKKWRQKRINSELSMAIKELIHPND
jgi:hypothetical protein